jgi:hypothetical protein
LAGPGIWRRGRLQASGTPERSAVVVLLVAVLLLVLLCRHRCGFVVVDVDEELNWN